MTEKILNFIDGEFQEAHSGQWLKIENPALGVEIAQVADSDAHDVRAAVEAAERAFPAWAALEPRERAKILRKISELIEKNVAELARLETLNTGKPLRVSTALDIPRAAQNFEFFADAITQWSSESHADGKSFNYTLRQPLGPVACISPWNLPLYLFTWKVAPALAAGNTVVGKPSEITPMTAAYLGKICQQAGLPRGVLNILHGRGQVAGAELCAHSSIKAVSFTGSTKSGAEIAKNAASVFKKTSLELGGKNATIVFKDAHFDQAVAETLRAAFSNQGQICLCGSRILVEKSIYPQFREALVQKISQLKVGDPMTSVDQGSLVSKMHFEKVRDCVDLAVREGGKILCGGKPAKIPAPFDKGYFFEPTLIEGLSMNSKTNQEEIFGPVATIAPFESEAEAVQLANATRYGLSASVWTSKLGRAHRVAARIESGIVWINTWMKRDLRTPFGGVKNSGVGREGGTDALRFFTETKNVCVELDEGNLP